MNTVERARTWLGTLVSIRVEAEQEGEAQAAIEAAFHEIAHVHRCMSFHDVRSDVSCLMREAHLRPMAVDSSTFEVLTAAQRFSECTNGAFDITVACELVRSGLLPVHEGVSPHGQARWDDIELLPGNRVYFRKPLSIDLGGIAKGFAVDRAVNRLQEMKVHSGVVNAGGDLRTFGDWEELILLDVPQLRHSRPCVQLSQGSLASSYAAAHAVDGTSAVVTHWDGEGRTPTEQARFVCVAAEECMTADALTKVVLCRGEKAGPVLQRWEAQACSFDPDAGWTYLNLDASTPTA